MSGEGCSVCHVNSLKFQLSAIKDSYMTTHSKLDEIDNEILKLEERIAELQSRRAELLNMEKTAKLAEVRKIISQYGITASELKLPAKTGKGRKNAAAPAPVAKVKYRSAAGETWSGGRGRKPQWVKEAMAAGTLEQSAVK
ncbi:H-NS histone family protein [Polaromonas sp. SM01]|uniref:H-NS histone family protein n=1 Tax=Polaromonas sp. SM01 TaxID=3085630 RepID=UPI0029818E3C|nr:H-NS histone family protein [Polaromonas sp. SM01]MDW5441695.1 H-NS histone family protein [Polaromonas sp. SM01]